jgi:2-oxoglutarate dehydrogenase E2 component (dihydrolipoamide succinyltransferase)
MATKILVPELGESIVEATVGPWQKQEGDHVTEGEALVELETDKINVEVTAERAGILTHIERKEGADVKVGAVLGVIEESPEGGAAAGKPAGKATTEKSAGEATTEKPAPEAATEKPAPAAAKPEEPLRTAPNAPKVTPIARQLAEEKGIDLARVPASEPGGRVTRQDIESYLEEQNAAPAEAPAKPPATPQPLTEVAAPPSAAPREPQQREREERQRMSRRRRTIAQRLVETHQAAAMLTTFNEIDMTAVIDIRRRRREAFQQQHGVKLGFMSFFVKAAVGALKAFPLLNAEIQGDEVVIKHYYNIGIAVGAAEGLVVPVLRHADQMSFAEIEKVIEELAHKSESATLSLEDLRGGTFTITNGGVFGSLLSTPILNAPQVGILGLHKIEERPIALNGQVVIRPMMYVALTYDHRIVDGREAVQFLVRIKQLTEDPESLLLEG